MGRVELTPTQLDPRGYSPLRDIKRERLPWWPRYQGNRSRNCHLPALKRARRRPCRKRSSHTSMDMRWRRRREVVGNRRARPCRTVHMGPFKSNQRQGVKIDQDDTSLDLVLYCIDWGRGEWLKEKKWVGRDWKKVEE